MGKRTPKAVFDEAAFALEIQACQTETVECDRCGGDWGECPCEDGLPVGQRDVAAPTQKGKSHMASSEALLAEISETLKAILETLKVKDLPASGDPWRGTCPKCATELTPENSSKTPSGKVVHIGCKVQPAHAEKPKAEAKPEEKAPEKPMSLDEFKAAAVAFCKKDGDAKADENKATMAANLAKGKWAKLSDVPEEKRRKFCAVVFGDIPF